MEGRRHRLQGSRVLLKLGRAALAIVVVMGVLAAGAEPAWAGGHYVCDGAGHCTWVVDSPGSPGGASGGGDSSGGGTGSSGPKTCTAKDGTFGPITSAKEPVWGDGFGPNTGAAPPPGETRPGHYYAVYCGGHFLDIEWVPDGTPPPGSAAAAVVDPATLAQQAVKQSALPPPHIHMNPDPTKGVDQVVGMATWLWVEGGDLVAPPVTVTAGGTSVTGSFSAQYMTWSTGDGSTQRCQGPGQPWTPGATSGPQACTHTYETSSAGQPGPPPNSFPVTATVTWTVTYTVNGGPGGTLPSQTTSSFTTVRVSEVQAINNG